MRDKKEVDYLEFMEKCGEMISGCPIQMRYENGLWREVKGVIKYYLYID